MDEQLTGLKNFAVNIRPIAHKLDTIIKYKAGDKATLTKVEANSLLQFYLETVNYLSKQ